MGSWERCTAGSSTRRRRTCSSSSLQPDSRPPRLSHPQACIQCHAGNPRRPWKSLSPPERGLQLVAGGEQRGAAEDVQPQPRTRHGDDQPPHVPEMPDSPRAHEAQQHVLILLPLVLVHRRDLRGPKERVGRSRRAGTGLSSMYWLVPPVVPVHQSQAMMHSQRRIQRAQGCSAYDCFHCPFPQSQLQDAG